jgi:hypothetical protein
LIGVAVVRLDSVRSLDRGGRIAIAGAAGIAIVGTILALLTIAGLPWSRIVILPLLGAIAVMGLYATRRDHVSRGRVRLNGRATAGIAVVIVLTTYGLLTARESCGDLHFFWGPKAIHFCQARGVTVAFLADKNNTSLNPGYPLLLPMIYSWSLMLSREFSWWAAVLLTALFLAGSVAIVRAATGDDEGALLMAATLAYAIAVAYAAGGAEPPLLFFETLTLVSVTYLGESKGATFLAALGLAACVMLKIEGTTFAIAVVVALLVTRRNWKTILWIAAPAALLIGTWILFLRSNSILEYYRGGAMPVYIEALPTTLSAITKTARYELLWLPWIPPVLLIALRANRRAAAVPLIVALLTLCAAIFYYLHAPDPTWWILSSAPRVLLTPLTALLIAAIEPPRSFATATP